MSPLKFQHGKHVANFVAIFLLTNSACVTEKIFLKDFCEEEEEKQQQQKKTAKKNEKNGYCLFGATASPSLGDKLRNSGAQRESNAVTWIFSLSPWPLFSFKGANDLPRMSQR